MPGYPDLSSLGDFIGSSASPITINGPFPGIGLIASATSINSLPYGTNGQVLTISAGVPTWATLASSWSFSGLTGTTQTVNLGDTVSFTGSNLITTVSAATNVLDISIDTTGATANQVVTFDGANVIWAASSGESTTVSDTNTVDLTLTGTDITADVKISATTPNILSAQVDGLLAQETVTTLVDNADGTWTYTSEDGTVTTIGDTSIINYTDLTNIPKNQIGNITNEAGTVIAVNENLTTLSQAIATGVITYTNEAGTAQTANVVSTDANNILTVGTDGGAMLNASTFTQFPDEYFDAFSGTTITLTNTPASADKIIVCKNGQVLRNGATRDYTLAGNVITLNVTASTDDMHIIFKV